MHAIVLPLRRVLNPEVRTRRHYRQNNLSDNWTRVLVYTGAALGLAVLISATSWSFEPQATASTKKPRLPGTEGSAFSTVEPAEGYESRWLSRRALATKRCQADPAVTSWPQMVRCALAYTFPEAGTWDAPGTVAWMREAQIRVETDLGAEVLVAYPGGDVNGWKAVLWLAGARVAESCYVVNSPAKTAACVAATLYPNAQWPPRSDSDLWQREFYTAVRALVGLNVTKPGLVRSAGA